MGNVNLQVITAGASASLWAYFSTIIIYLINGIAFGCWTDPDSVGAGSSAITAAWTCTMHLPSIMTTSIEGVITSAGTFAVGYFTTNTHKNGIP